MNINRLKDSLYKDNAKKSVLKRGKEGNLFTIFKQSIEKFVPGFEI
jgi:hypothetical protein